MTDKAASPVLSREEARSLCLHGWNLRCNNCGSFGAKWLRSLRPGWGAIALCPSHEGQLRVEQQRHKRVMDALLAVRFEQPRQDNTDSPVSP